MSDAWIGVIGALAGVVLAFGFTIGYDALKAANRRGELLRALRGECSALIGHAHSMQDILKQSVAALHEEKVLPGAHVRSPRTVYSASIAELTPALTERQRNMLHVAYERMRVGDELLEGQEDTIIKMKEIVTAKNFSAVAAFAVQLTELSEGYEVAKGLLQKFLDGEEVDVYQLKSGPVRAK